MNLLLIAAPIAVLLLAVALACVISTRSAKRTEIPPQVQSELHTIAHNLELPRASIVAGLSEARDLAFITAHAPKLQKMLIRERSRLVRSWLRENQAYLRQLLRLHRLIERTSENLSVAVEFRVAATCAWLQVMLLAADAVVLLAGPFRARSIGLTTLAAFNHLSSTIAATLAPLNAAQKAAIRNGWSQAA